MNKNELINKVHQLRKEVIELKENNNFLLKQQKNLKHMAEKFGSKVATWKYKSIKLENQNENLLSKIKVLEQVRK